MDKSKTLGTLVVCAFLALPSAARANPPASGVCNPIVARSLGTLFQVTQGVGDVVEQCAEIGALLGEFAAEGCFGPFFDGELALNRAAFLGAGGGLSPLGTAVCTVLVVDCGFPLPPALCGEFEE